MEKMLSDYSLIKREELELDLREMGKEILRELFLSSRCLSLYTQEHPAEEEVSKKPYNWIKKLFRLRSYFDFHLYQGRLYSMGIPMKEEVFIRGLKAELSRFGLGSVYIYSQVMPEELIIFLRRLSEKLIPLPKYLNLQKYLEENKINSIRVKKAEPEDALLEENISLIEKCNDFEVKTLARLSLQEDPQVMLDILVKRIRKDIDLEGRVKFDFRLKIFQSILLEEFSKLSPEKVEKFLEKEFERKNWVEVSRDAEYSDGVKNLVKAFIHHPERELLFGRLKAILIRQGAPEDFFERALDESARFKIKTLEDSEAILNRLVSGEAKTEEEKYLNPLFIKLINLNQVERLRKTINALLQNLLSEKENLRVTSLFWLKIFFSLSLKYSKELSRCLVQETLCHKEQIDFQFMEYCAEQAIIFKEYGLFNKIIRELKEAPGKGHSPEKDAQYKRLIQGFVREEIIQQFIGEIKSKRKEVWEKVGEALVLIGGEQIARALESILTYPDRTVRQVVLKIAGGLGEEGAIFFSRLLQDDSNFQRDQSGNLTLDSWFKIRNILNILSEIKSEKALAGLEKRVNDPDPKVKKELLQTLEKIGGKKSEEALLALAQDQEKEVKKLALMALGSCGSESSVDKLKELFYKDEDNAILILHTINNVGGEKGFKFLTEVINQPRIFEKGISGKKIDEEIKLEAVRVLKKRNDTDSAKEMGKLRDRYDRIKFLADKTGQLSKS